MVGIFSSIFQIHSDRPSLDHTFGRQSGVFGLGAVPCLDIRRNRNGHCGCDSRDHLQHFIALNLLAVGISHAESYTSTGGRERGKAGLLNHARAGNVPDIGQQQRSRPAVQCAKHLSFCPLLFGV